MSTSKSMLSDHYFVHHQGQVQGPFGLDFIEAMIFAGVYPGSVIVKKCGTSVQIAFSDLRSLSNYHSAELAPSRNENRTTQSSSRANQPHKKQRSKKPNFQAVFVQIIGVLAIPFGIWIIVAAASPKKQPKSSFSPTSNSVTSSYSYSQPVRPLTLPSQPIRNYPSAIAGSPSADTMVYRDASGRTYRVSNSDYYRLSTMKSALSLKQSRMNAEEARLKLLAQEVDRERATLDRYSEYAVDAFNRKIDQINFLDSKVQQLLDDYNGHVDSFNRELERVGTPIN